MFIIKYLNKSGVVSSITTTDKDVVKNIAFDCIDNDFKLIAFDSDDRFSDILIHRPEFGSLEAHHKAKAEKTQDPNLDYFFKYVMSI